MYFYPRSLKSEWYMTDVCSTIATALEAYKNWTQYYYENAAERQAYVEAFEHCQQLVRYSKQNPQAMMEALSDYHTLVTVYPKQPSFFSLARWFYDVPGAREAAVRLAFHLVDNINARYLS